MSSQFVLASSSPRRKELLEKVGFTVRTIPVDVDETPMEKENPTEMVKRLGRSKVLAAVERIKSTTSAKDDGLPMIHGGVLQATRQDTLRWAVGADTVVVLDGDILGKPRDQDHAFEMLQRLSNRQHQVITGFCVFDMLKNKEGLQAVISTVSFKSLSRPEIEKYLATGESMDKAGAYAIQGIGSYIIDSIHGSYTNVVGLPLCQLMEMLEEMGAHDILPY